jgi:hypothetical protein
VRESLPSDWVVEVEGGDERWVPCRGALAEHGHVVAVQMHGMASEELVLDDEVDPLVLDVQREEIAVGGVAGATGEGPESWVGKVNVHGSVVDEPAEDGSIIGSIDSGHETRGNGADGVGELLQGTTGFLDVGNNAGDGLVEADSEISSSLATGGGSWEREIGTLVDEHTVGVSETIVGAARWTASLSDSTQEVTGSCLVHLHDDIVSLTNSNVEPLSLVWLDGNIVGGDDSHLVVVEVNGPHVLGRRVDDAEEIFLAGLDLPESVLASAQIWEGVGTVEHVVPCS